MPNRYYKITNLRNGQVVADKAIIARDFKSRAIGLLNRKDLEKGEALVIEPCGSVHTFFMKFCIDLMFLDKEFKVIKTAKSVSPWRLSGCLFGSQRVIELPQRTLEEFDVKPGDSIKVSIN